jgi:acetyl-CoA C-acetyltransferase
VEADGIAVVEGYTIRHERDAGPVSIPVFARSEDGRRIVARNDDPQTAAALSGGMLVGESIVVHPGEDCASFELG